MRIEFDDRAAKPQRDMASMSSEVISRGNEVLTGEIRNASLSHTAQMLEGVGLALRSGAGTQIAPG